MTPEGKVVAAIKREARLRLGETRKVEWSGRRGAPDLLVLLPKTHFFVEAKAPGEKPRPDQLREHTRLRKAGFRVYVVDSEEAAVELFMWVAVSVEHGIPLPLDK